eukprot:CAMPEP_0174842454 /NCGR_PEP_ID=MMETSP1114-20130205/9927_1 /TAXON_ID=312471 /ORGANISM="Neobodo designis, Strain CCAP 1951/1" /LENGTH=52 /DNA_ID=CAMNT_0016076657 /DNA_START=50 /DNA_END=205 /DNA_ORIENTATION=+
MALVKALVLHAALVAACASLWYPLGAGPKDYHKGDNVKVKVNVLTSVTTHLP